jgi:SAM-dependent methyltransferase
VSVDAPSPGISSGRSYGTPAPAQPPVRAVSSPSCRVGFACGTTGRRETAARDEPSEARSRATFTTVLVGGTPLSAAGRIALVSPPHRPRPAWLPDELRYAGRENLDAGHVARYDEKEDAGAEREVALLRELGLGPASHVVEVGAGTGQFSVAVAPECTRVVAVDVSPLMLDALRAKVASRALANVEVVRAGFLTYEHAGPPADFVYSRLALHHLPDLWKALALARLRAVLRPGGVLRLVDVVYDFGPDEAPARLEAWCAAYGEGGEEEWGRADVEEHVRDEHSTFTWLLEPMIDRSGFTIERVEHSQDGVLAAYVLRAPSN